MIEEGKISKEGIDIENFISSYYNAGDVILDVEDQEDNERVIITLE